MFRKIILYFLLSLTIFICFLYLSFLYKFNSIDSRFQLETVKVLISYYTEDFYLFGGLENQATIIEKKSLNDQNEFYYSIIILGAKYLENNGDGSLLLYNLLQKRNNENIIEKIQLFKQMKTYKKLTDSDKILINYWEKKLIERNCCK